jgi:hypothetical protein
MTNGAHIKISVGGQQYVWDKVIFRKTESDANSIRWEDCGHRMEEVKPDYNKSLGPAARRQARTLSLRRAQVSVLTIDTTATPTELLEVFGVSRSGPRGS